MIRDWDSTQHIILPHFLPRNKSPQHRLYMFHADRQDNRPTAGRTAAGTFIKYIYFALYFASSMFGLDFHFRFLSKWQGAMVIVVVYIRNTNTSNIYYIYKHQQQLRRRRNHHRHCHHFSPAFRWIKGFLSYIQQEVESSPVFYYCAGRDTSYPPTSCLRQLVTWKERER
jgi:hypothetical protein